MYAKIRERHTFKNKFKVLGEQRKDLVYIESVCVCVSGLSGEGYSGRGSDW